jgi:hypothetical protein
MRAPVAHSLGDDAERGGATRRCWGRICECDTLLRAKAFTVLREKHGKKMVEIGFDPTLRW